MSFDMSRGDYSSMSASLTSSPTALDTHQDILKGLQSQRTSDKLTALKTLLAMTSRGENMAAFFPYVIQEITSDDETIRHLSYVFLEHYSDSDPETALMCINTFQRSLTDVQPIVRTLALKVLTSIRNQDLLPIILESIELTSRDMSPFVRRASAIALLKVYQASPETLPQLTPILDRLLNDPSIITISGALFTLTHIPHPLSPTLFQSLSNILIKLDPSGQSIALHLLKRYAQTHFPAPQTQVDWFSDDTAQVHPALENLISNALPLLNSTSPSVTIAASSLIFTLSPPFKQQLVTKPLIRLLYTEYSTPSLSVISHIISINKEIFVPHLRHFYVNDYDQKSDKLLKLKILSQLCRPSNSDIVGRSIQQQIDDSDDDVAVAAVTRLGETALGLKDCQTAIVCFTRLLSSERKNVKKSAIKSLCLLLMKRKDIDFVTTVKKMLVWFNSLDGEGKSDILAVVGKSKDLKKESEEVLRQVSLVFGSQSEAVRSEAIGLAGRVLATCESEIANYVIRLGLCDMNVTVRDRARLVERLVSLGLGNCLMFDERVEEDRVDPDIDDGDTSYEVKVEQEVIRSEIGSLSAYFGRQPGKGMNVVEWGELKDELFNNEEDIEQQVFSDIKSNDVVEEEDDLDSYFN